MNYKEIIFDPSIKYKIPILSIVNNYILDSRCMGGMMWCCHSLIKHETPPLETAFL